MSEIGQFCLLAALVGSGYAAFACMVGWFTEHRPMRRGGVVAGAGSVVALTIAVGMLAWALLTGDLSFAYVVEYANGDLSWQYALSAIWAGQAGSLLVWAWFLGLLAAVHRFRPRREPSPLCEPTFALLMAYLAFLTSLMVFGADPMAPSLSSARLGQGLNPLLQHPAMLIHPPIVFLGYAGWAVPFALAMAAMLGGRGDTRWIAEARSWALFAWLTLGGGIILGGLWAYEELGWGGYWAWDPVENGSLIPWLTGTALIHALMVWQYRGSLKKTALALATATFGLCNFATFLTRSGFFSSLHAFGQSPLGWMFLALMIGLALGGGLLIVLRRAELRPQTPIQSVWAREAGVLISIVALLLLAAVAWLGTLATPVSNLVFGRSVTVGLAFYNNVLIPTGLLLLTAMAAAPLLRWGKQPAGVQRRMLWLAGLAGGLAVVVAAFCGLGQPIHLAVVALAIFAAAALAGALLLDARRRESGVARFALFAALGQRRRQYAGYLIHLGFAALAVGVAGSSLGSRQHEVALGQGETVAWAGRTIRYQRMIRREVPGKLVEEVEIEVAPDKAAAFTLRPAQLRYTSQDQWTSEVAIHSTWSGDFYAIYHGEKDEAKAGFTLIDNPGMRWIWAGGWLFALGSLARLWPNPRRPAAQAAVPAPHWMSAPHSVPVESSRDLAA